ncbi:MAG TPA: DNA alkylation repair protein [Dissulfurispiraceae bacterium]|nr:DNA alkylation repair protein [Dissulfurispiraceae bacterium]
MIDNIKAELAALGNPVKADFLPRFFKAHPGGYAEGDIFIGISVPDIRAVAKKYRGLSLAQVKKLLRSGIHEHRLAALLILTDRFLRAGEDERAKIVQFYLDNLSRVNNWDLVDLSADKLLGAYLIDRDKTVLYELCDSGRLWNQRVAIMSTFHFIRKGRFGDTFRLAERLLRHKHDLIHKAVGWMLREVGKRDRGAEERFLKKHYKTMPRTMLRYAIEKFETEERSAYLKGLV